jgi:porin
MKTFRLQNWQLANSSPFRLPDFATATAVVILFLNSSLQAQPPSEAPSAERRLQTWWDSGSALPEIDVRMERTLNRKVQLTQSSVIPETNLRQDWADAGVSFFGAYTAFFLGNVSGGLEQDFAYNHMLFFQLNFDLERLAGWHGGTIVWSWADNAGSDLSNSIGNNFQVSTDYGPNTFMFNEFYLMQHLLDDRLSIKAGQLSALNDFMASPLYGYYSNLAFCGNPVAVSFNVPVTVMPVSSWGLHVKYAEPDWYAQAAVYQVSDRLGKPAYHGLDYSIRSGDGTLFMAEAGWTPTFFQRTAEPLGGKDAKATTPAETEAHPGYPGNYKIGGYFSNYSFSSFNSNANQPNMFGLYVLADQMVFQEPGSPDQGLYLWSAFTVSPQQSIAQMPYFLSGGIQYAGLLPHRDKDRSIFGVAYGRYSSDLGAQQVAQSLPQETYEMVFEWAYQIQVNPWLTVQPDVQYIVNPGATGTIQNAWVLGAIVSVSF